MTGHSVGGALATIAAAELRGQFAIAGIYTFGQPRLGDGRTVDFFQTYYPRAFHRFVFDDDIVTRIPPGYQHAGKLYHFDANGFLLPPVTEATGLSSEPPELTKEEFEQLRRTAKMIRDEAKAATLGAPEASVELADRSLEGIFPSISDHRMSRYLFAVRNQIPRSKELISETVVYQALEAFDVATVRAARKVGEKYPVQVRVRDLSWKPPQGVIVNSQIGPFFSLQATKGDIAGMQHDPGVSSLDLGREFDFPAIQECAVSVPFVKADTVHTGPLHERRGQAIVALIDSRRDILHEAFLDRDLSSQGVLSRIEAEWIQRERSNQIPDQVNRQEFLQNEGKF